VSTQINKKDESNEKEFGCKTTRFQAVSEASREDEDCLRPEVRQEVKAY
jgi:hypothetical protein